MQRTLLNPKIDFIFKKIFGSEEYPGILIAFLNTVGAGITAEEAEDIINNNFT